jgi:phosphoribosyl-ATP pyrophosphohydrolase/phosphoribosyl-AMP cyclohydrolase
MNDVKFDESGLVPAIVKDGGSGAVLMLAWMNAEALQKTVESGETWFWSRSRRQLWNKGATSGNRQRVVAIATDCDRDALLVTVVPAGPSCHTGARSCFDDDPAGGLALGNLMTVLRQRFHDRPDGSYSTWLFERGTNKILKKIGEEATEVVLAAKGEGRERLASEIADLVFHLSALLVEQGMEWNEVADELAKRSGSGPDRA